MSGGAHEYVAAYSKNIQSKSDFSDEQLNTYSSYFDKYPDDSNVTSYKNRILGDATGEMGPFYYYWDKDGKKRYHNAWYADQADFIEPGWPWFVRGISNSDGVIAGQFCFVRSSGEGQVKFTFRLVLSPV